MRNFGVTSGTALGAKPQSRSPMREQLTRNSEIRSSGLDNPSASSRPDWESLRSVPFFIEANDYELGAGLLAAFVIAAPVVIVGGIVMGYMVFVGFGLPAFPAQ